jgi:hypothetical protein
VITAIDGGWEIPDETPSPVLKTPASSAPPTKKQAKPPPLPAATLDVKFVWVEDDQPSPEERPPKKRASPPVTPPVEIEVNPAWLESNDPGVILSEAPSSVSFADAVRVFIGPEGEVELASHQGAPRGYVEAVIVSTAVGARLTERLGRSKSAKGRRGG